MKKGFSFLLLLFIILNGCNSKTTDKTASAHHDSIQKYIALAGNDTLEFNQRIKYNDKALSLVNLADNDSLTRENLNKIVYNYFMTKDSLKFKKYSRLYYKKAVQQKDTLGLARYYKYTAAYYSRESIFDSAFFYYLKSEKLYKKIKNYEGIAKVNSGGSFVQFKKE